MALLALLSLLTWYAIPFGKNLKGILCGYSLFVGMSAIALTLVSSYWEKIQMLWSYLQPIFYVLVLAMWAKALWTPDAVPSKKPEMKLEQDYAELVAQTGRLLGRARARLGWAART